MSNFDLPDDLPAEQVRQKTIEYQGFLEVKYPLCSQCAVRVKTKIENLNRKIKRKLDSISLKSAFSVPGFLDLNFIVPALFLAVCLGFWQRRRFLWTCDVLCLLFFGCKSAVVPLGFCLQPVGYWIRIGYYLLLILCFCLREKRLKTKLRIEEKQISPALLNPSEPPKIDQIFNLLNVNDEPDEDKDHFSFSQKTLESVPKQSLFSNCSGSAFANLPPSKFSFECGLENSIEAFSFAAADRKKNAPSSFFSQKQPSKGELHSFLPRKEASLPTVPMAKAQNNSFSSHAATFLVLLHRPWLQLVFLIVLHMIDGSFFRRKRMDFNVSILLLIFFQAYTGIWIVDLIGGGSVWRKGFFFVFAGVNFFVFRFGVNSLL